MATQTLPQAAPTATAITPLRINLADKTLTGRSVAKASDSLLLAGAVELPFGDNGHRNIPESIEAGKLIRLAVRGRSWMPIFDKDDTLLFDTTLTPDFGNVVLVGRAGEAAYICRYERGDRDETAYTLFSAIQSFGEQMKQLPVWGWQLNTSRPATLKGLNRLGRRAAYVRGVTASL